MVFCRALARLWDAHKSSESVSQADASTNMPRDRACGRRGHAHAVGACRRRCMSLGGQFAARACDQGCDAAGTGKLAIVVGPDHGAVAAEALKARQRRKSSSNGAAWHCPCGSFGAQGDRERRRRHSGDFHRHTLGARRNSFKAAWCTRGRSCRGSSRIQTG